MIHSFGRVRAGIHCSDTVLALSVCHSQLNMNTAAFWSLTFEESFSVLANLVTLPNRSRMEKRRVDRGASQSRIVQGGKIGREKVENPRAVESLCAFACFGFCCKVKPRASLKGSISLLKYRLCDAL